MSIQNFFKSLISSPTRRRPIRRRPPAFRPCLEALEDRVLLSHGISFMAPIDFATGATPGVTAAFNAASGDQVALVLARASLTDGVVVGDFNHDGNLDVAQTNVIAGSVSVFLGDGHGGFAPAQIYQVGANPVSIVAGDLTGNGKLDLVVADFGSNDLSILLGNGDGTFTPGPRVPVPAPPRNVAIGNFDGDGIPDLAVACSGPTGGPVPSVGGVAILHGIGHGAFAPAQLITVTAGPNNLPAGANVVAVGDFNGDGRDDLAVGVGASGSAGDTKPDGTTTGDDVLIFLNQNQLLGTIPEQPFSTMPNQRIRVGPFPSAIAVADLNGDGYLDLAVVGSGRGDITTLLGDAQGHFAFKAQTVTIGGVGRSVAVADFNNDGIPDLVTANVTSSTVSVLQGNGDGTFQPAVDFWAGDATTGAAVGDFNGDGRVDVVAGRLRTDQLSLLLNDSPQPGDRVRIDRDIYYLPTDPTADLLAVHHTLDVYAPPPGTASFAGRGQPYPVVFFVHGGAWITGDKSGNSYLMSSLARQGIVAISINYRLAADPRGDPNQPLDVAHAFDWVFHNVATYGGDPNNIFAFGHSAGADLVGILMTDPTLLGGQGLSLSDIRGAVLAGFGGTPAHSTPVASQPPSLFLDGTEGLEPALAAHAGAFYAASIAAGAESHLDIIAGRDHFTLPADMALPDDPARVFMLNFMQGHLIPNPTSDASTGTGVACGPVGANSSLTLSGAVVPIIGQLSAGTLSPTAPATVTETVALTAATSFSTIQLSAGGTVTAAPGRGEVTSPLLPAAQSALDQAFILLEHDASALGKSATDVGYLWYFDGDGDGDVDGLDNGQFNRRFGQY